MVVSIGVKQMQEMLRTALAMWADRAISVVIAGDAHQDIEPLAVAQILTGKQAIDNGMNATGQMLVALLSWGYATGPSPRPRDHRAKDAAHHRAG